MSEKINESKEIYDEDFGNNFYICKSNEEDFSLEIEAGYIYEYEDNEDHEYFCFNYISRDQLIDLRNKINKILGD